MTVQEIKEKINSRDFLVGALIVLVGFASFGLGRLSKLSEVKVPIEIRGAEEQQAAIASTPLSRGGQIVASKTGAKYHFPWCAGASQIAEKNKVWFASVEEARKAGYTPASNCKGLQ